jgi:hypothetical protein
MGQLFIFQETNVFGDLFVNPDNIVPTTPTALTEKSVAIHNNHLCYVK